KERKEVSTSKMMTKADASPFYLPYSIRHPLVLPRHGHITNIIVRHYHERVKHQGRGITMNEILANGFWILGCRSAVDSIIRTCSCSNSLCTSSFINALRLFLAMRGPFRHIRSDRGISLVQKESSRKR
ncbi:hypothetical protein MAR_034377, partial [Mya arenaria]